MTRTTPVSVAIIGAGYIADYHLSVLQSMKTVKVVGACDPNKERLDALCRRWNIPHSADSVPQLLNEAKPEVVHVLVPPPLHFAVTAEVLNAGAHAFVEKPMALQSTECHQLLGLAGSKNRRLGVNHNAVYHPLFRRLLRDVANGKLGRVQHVISVQTVPLAQLESGDHDHWMFRRPVNVLLEQGPHPFSQICELLGSVRAVATNVGGERRLRTGEVFLSLWQVAITCEKGTAQVLLSFGGWFPEAGLNVFGQDGVAHVDLLNNRYVLDRQTKYVEPLDRFLRGLNCARQTSGASFRGFFQYGLSMLRLMGRCDPFYQSMCGSIEAFYASLLAGERENTSALLGRSVIEALEKTVRGLPEKQSVSTCESDPRNRPPEAHQSVNGHHGEVLVLGGTGFIGQRLVPALIAAGYVVRLLVRRPALMPEKLKQLHPKVFVGDVRNANEVDRAVERCRAVIHLVAGSPPTWPEFEKLFIDGVRNVAAACLKGKVSQLFFVSSIAAYYLGRAGVTITETTPLDLYPDRRCDYSRAKIACEQLLMEVHHSRGLPATIFRPGIVVGSGGLVEHSGAGFWPSATHCVTWGRKQCKLPFVLVDDIVSALVSALGKTGLEGKTFNLVGDVRLSASEYVEALRSESGRAIRLHRQSLFTWMTIDIVKWAIKALARKPGNVFPSYRDLVSRSMASPFDCSEAKRVLNWQPVADRERFIELGIRQALKAKAQL